MKKQSTARNVVDRARTAYPKALASAVAYLGPLATPKERRPSDARLARMSDADVAALARQDPAAAAAGAERLGVLDARAAAAPAYPDIVDE